MNANSTFSASLWNSRRRDTPRWLTGIRASQYPKFGDASRPTVVCRSNLINVNQATSLSPGRRKDAIRLAGNISIVFSSMEMRFWWWREFYNITITKEKITRVLFIALFLPTAWTDGCTSCGNNFKPELFDNCFP